MIVVTISNWRRKMVWLLAILLIAVVLAVGQAGWHQDKGMPAQTRPTLTTPAENNAAVEKGGFWENIWLKLKEYYRGK
ncbi:MAG: hypothetical protein PWP65_1705 [Clostridia bacterium]|nr:hypothetical protein [Clostridia bacterium]